MLFFGPLPSPDVVIAVDASDYDLCALDALHRCALTHQYPDEDAALLRSFKNGDNNGFDINLRELLSCAHATYHFGQSWQALAERLSRQGHVQFRIDNTSAVAWQSRMHSRNPRAQVLIRLPGVWESRYQLRFSSVHVPGQQCIGDGRFRQELARYLREHSVAPSTFDKYRSHYDRWVKFCVVRLVDPRLTRWSLPDRVAIVSAFVLECAAPAGRQHRVLQSSSISNILHGINHFFAARGDLSPVGYSQISMLLKGLSRTDNPASTNAPVSLRLLEACFRRLDFRFPFDQALWGILCVAFFFLLGRSEIVAQKTRSKWFALRTTDFTFLDQSGLPTTIPDRVTSVRMSLRGSKTDQRGTSALRHLTRSGHKFICPVFVALLLQKAHDPLPASWQAATVPDSSSARVVGAEDLANLLKASAIDLGIDPREYSTHSLRIGGATHLYRAGIDQATIQFQGRWVSDSVKRSMRLTTEITSQLAPAMVSGSRADTRVDRSQPSQATSLGQSL